jgi:hypothetical protein
MYATFLLLNVKVDKFQLRLKTAASLFPFSSVTFLIAGLDALRLELVFFRTIIQRFRLE